MKALTLFSKINETIIFILKYLFLMIFFIFSIIDLELLFHLFFAYLSSICVKLSVLWLKHHTLPKIILVNALKHFINF